MTNSTYSRWNGGDQSGYPFFPIVDAGVDWITLTCAEPESRDRFREIGVSLLHVQGEMGEKITPSTVLGFEGLKTEGVGYGEMQAMSYLRLSGQMAQHYWRQPYDLATNCSRIDLQVTVGDVDQPAEQIVVHHAEAVKHHAGWLRPPTIDLRLSNRSSPTLYLNTRQSSTFGRVYDKANESKEARWSKCLRYEAQFHGKRALFTASRVRSCGADPVEAVPRVSSFFCMKGLSLPWKFEQQHVPMSARRRSIPTRRLRWLSTQVRGCVTSLIEAGYEREVFEAMGLESYLKAQDE